MTFPTEVINEITHKLEYLGRIQVDTNRRRVNAETHGWRLAKAVSDYLADPEYVGRDHIDQAMHFYYSASAGSFNLSIEQQIEAMEPKQATG